jgi:hypothetical protein
MSAVGVAVLLLGTLVTGASRAEAKSITVQRTPDGTPIPAAVAGDFSGDGKTDLALTGGAGWKIAPVATSNADGSFTPRAGFVGDFSIWAQAPGAQLVTGDFNGDGRSDFALAGAGGWNTIPVAFSNGDGTFRVTNASSPSFAAWAYTPYGAKLWSGDFNHDGKDDLALTSAGYFSTIPVAFSNGDGTFRVTNAESSGFAGLVLASGAQLVTGDFNGDGRSDFALAGAGGWSMIPVAFSNGDGTFRVTTVSSPNFAGWAYTPYGAKLTAGDFNHDGKDDLALTSAGYFTTIPVAFSNGDGSFTVTNASSPDFAFWSKSTTAKILTADFNGDGRADIGLVGDPNWSSIPVAFSNGDGTFRVTNVSTPDFAFWSTSRTAQTLTGDFNGDRRTDLALIGDPNWVTIPVAFSNGDGSFRVTNAPAQAAAAWAAQPPPIEAALCNCSAPTAALTTLANSLRVRSKSVSAIATVPAGLPVTNSTDVVAILPNGTRLPQSYVRSTGNRFLMRFPESNGARRTETIQFELTEHAASGPVTFRFSMPVTVEPLYDVTLSALTFELVTDCDFTLGVFPEDSEVEINMSDDRGQRLVDFDDLRAFSQRTVSPFARQLHEVSVATGIQVPQVAFDETDPPNPLNPGFSSWPGSPPQPMVPGASRHVHIDDVATGPYPDPDCHGSFDYDIGIGLLTYDEL